MSRTRRLAAALAGHDCFISYSRQDRASYSARLASALERRGLLVCFDRTDFSAGDSLSDVVRRLVARSALVVLIDSPRARQSAYVADELRVARRRGRRILRVADPALRASPWDGVDTAIAADLADAISLDESGEALAGGAPSVDVVDGIVTSSRRFRAARQLIAATVILVAGVTALGVVAWRQNRSAAAQQFAARASRTEHAAEALTLALRAADTSPSDEARLALSHALSAFHADLALPESSRGRFAAFAVDGTAIVTAHADGSSAVWESREGSLLLSLPALDTRADARGSGARQLWDDPLRRRFVEMCRQHGARVPELSPDCTRIVAGEAVWDMDTGRRLFGLEPERPVLTNLSSIHGMMVVTSGARDGVRLRSLGDASFGRALQPCIRANLHAAAFSRDGRHVAGTGDEEVCVWDVASGRLVWTRDGRAPADGRAGGGGEPRGVGHTDWVVAVAYSRDGARLVTASQDQTARVWDAATGRVLQTLVGHAAPVNHAEFSDDGQWVVTAAGSERLRPPGAEGDGRLDFRDPTVRIWSADGALMRTVPVADEIVYSAAFAPEGHRFVAAGDRGTSTWIVDARREEDIGRPDARGSADLVRDTHDADAASGGPSDDTWQVPDAPLATAAVAGDRMLAVYENAIAWWSTRRHVELQRIPIEDVSFSRARVVREGTRIIGTDEANVSTVLDDRGARLGEFEGDYEAWSADGRWLLTLNPGDKTATLWTEGLMAVHEWSGGEVSFTSGDVSPDGRMVALADEHGLVRVWLSASGEEYDRLPLLATPRPAFSADGRTMLVVEHGVVHRYPLQLEELKALARERLRRLTAGRQ